MLATINFVQRGRGIIVQMSEQLLKRVRLLSRNGRGTKITLRLFCGIYATKYGRL